MHDHADDGLLDSDGEVLKSATGAQLIHDHVRTHHEAPGLPSPLPTVNLYQWHLMCHERQRRQSSTPPGETSDRARLVALVAEAEALLEPLICREPDGVGGSQPGRHCAACCMGTGYLATSDEEQRLAESLDALIRAGRRALAVTSPTP